MSSHFESDFDSRLVKDANYIIGARICVLHLFLSFPFFPSLPSSHLSHPCLSSHSSLHSFNEMRNERLQGYSSHDATVGISFHTLIQFTLFEHLLYTLCQKKTLKPTLLSFGLYLQAFPSVWIFFQQIKNCSDINVLSLLFKLRQFYFQSEIRYKQ